MTDVTVLNNRWSLELTGRRIPAEAQYRLEQADVLLKQANDAYRQAELDAEALRKQAYSAGLADGRSEAIAQAAEYLAQAQRAAQDYLSNHEPRLISLSAAMTKRIVRGLPYDSVLSGLISSAIDSLRADRYLRIHVHPDAAAIVRTRLEALLGLSHLGPAFEVIPDATLDTYDCIAESELGSVYAGLNDQLEILQRAALQALEGAHQSE